LTIKISLYTSLPSGIILLLLLLYFKIIRDLFCLQFRELRLDGLEYFPSELLKRIIEFNPNLTILGLAGLINIDMEIITAIQHLPKMIV
jgi:hypothetical protein